MTKTFILNLLIEFFKLDFFLKGLRKYSHFGGREGRKDFFLFQTSVILIFLGLQFFLKEFDSSSLSLFYIVFIFPPVISSMVRRLHDVGKSAWVLPMSVLVGGGLFIAGALLLNGNSYTLGLMVIFSFLIMCYPLFLMFFPSQKTSNKFNNQPSHPIKHGILLFAFILIFMTFLYLFGLMMNMVNVLPKEESLTAEEIKEIDALIQKYQETK